MIKAFLIYLTLIVGVSQAFASIFFMSVPVVSNNDLILENDSSLTEKIIEISARSISDRNYFKILIQNEEESSVYSLVREYANGEFESVDLKFGHKNNINQPIWYSIVDKDVPCRDFKYTLYRITATAQVLKQWDYNSETNELCEVPEDVIAVW